MKKNFYKDILETIREPLCVVDSSETILYRNPAFDQHFQIDESADFHAFSQLPEKYTSISLIQECIRDKKSETRVLQEVMLHWKYPSLASQKTRVKRTAI